MTCSVEYFSWNGFEVHIDSGWELHIFHGPLRSLLLSMNCLCVKISNRKTDCTKVFLCCGHMRILATVLRSREQANVGNQINDEPPHTMKKGQIIHRVICLARVGNHNAGSNCSRSQGDPSESHGCPVKSGHCGKHGWNIATCQPSNVLPSSPQISHREYRLAIFSPFLIKIFLVWQCDSLMIFN